MSDKIHVEGCPFCGATLLEAESDGEKIWRHPPEFYLIDGATTPQPVAPEDQCLFTGYYLLKRDVSKWNNRPKPMSPQREIQAGACSRCHSLTPATFSKICGFTECPHKEY